MSGYSVGWRKNSISIAPLLQRGIAFSKGVDLAMSDGMGWDMYYVMHVSSVQALCSRIFVLT